jgi:hypothetical protein
VSKESRRRPAGDRYLAAQPDVWLTTSDEIAEHYLRTAAPCHS